MARWRVDIIRKRAEHLGTVEAANAQEAKKIVEAEPDYRREAEQGQRVTLGNTRE